MRLGFCYSLLQPTAGVRCRPPWTGAFGVVTQQSSESLPTTCPCYSLRAVGVRLHTQEPAVEAYILQPLLPPCHSLLQPIAPLPQPATAHHAPATACYSPPHPCHSLLQPIAPLPQPVTAYRAPATACHGPLCEAHTYTVGRC